jgi:hypothetical protein
VVADDMEASPLHVIFDSKGVLVGKGYFKNESPPASIV